MVWSVGVQPAGMPFCLWGMFEGCAVTPSTNGARCFWGGGAVGLKSVGWSKKCRLV